MTEKKSRLGRGLASLVSPTGLDKLLPSHPKSNSTITAGQPLLVKVELIRPNPMQPRRDFKENDLASLAQSIKAKGIIEPLVVIKKNDQQYEIIAGERRLRAAIIANLKEVPVIIRDLEEDEPADNLILALLENICRKDLNPLEEAESFAKLEKDFGKTHQEIATMIGRERPSVTNIVRLLKLPDFIKEDIRQSRFSAGHGRAILGLRDHNLMPDLRAQIITKNLTVRQTESLVKKLNSTKHNKLELNGDQIYFEALAQAFTKELDGLKVIISPKGPSPKIEIFYKKNEGLEKIMNKLGILPL